MCTRAIVVQCTYPAACATQHARRAGAQRAVAHSTCLSGVPPYLTPYSATAKETATGSVTSPCAVAEMRFLPVLLAAMQQQQALGYSATVSVDVTVEYYGGSAAGIFGLVQAEQWVDLAGTISAYFGLPNDVNITTSLHGTVPSVIQLIASTASESSTATLQQNFSELTIDAITPVVLGGVIPEKFAAIAALFIFKLVRSRFALNSSCRCKTEGSYDLADKLVM